MIIRQTTTIVFEYPQDYLQEQEWCKTKEDRWVHKSTDTLGAVYENQISYSIGQPNSSEIPNNCEPQTERPRTICGVPSGAEAQTHSDTASVEKERESDGFNEQNWDDNVRRRYARNCIGNNSADTRYGT